MNGIDTSYSRHKLCSSCDWLRWVNSLIASVPHTTSASRRFPPRTFCDNDNRRPRTADKVRLSFFIQSNIYRQCISLTYNRPDGCPQVRGRNPEEEAVRCDSLPAARPMLGGEIKPFAPDCLTSPPSTRVRCLRICRLHVVLLGGSNKSHSAEMIVARKKTLLGFMCLAIHSLNFAESA